MHPYGGIAFAQTVNRLQPAAWAKTRSKEKDSPGVTASTEQLAVQVVSRTLQLGRKEDALRLGLPFLWASLGTHEESAHCT